MQDLRQNFETAKDWGEFTQAITDMLLSTKPNDRDNPLLSAAKLNARMILLRDPSAQIETVISQGIIALVEQEGIKGETDV